MKKYKYVLFDMDGTITDSYDAVVNSFVYALNSYGIKDYDRENMSAIIGPPLRDAFVNMFGLDEESALGAVEKYRERYNRNFLREHRIFDGIPELFESLCRDGFKLVLATSKPLAAASQILEHFDLKKYFFFLGGASLDMTRDTKKKVLEYIFDECDIDKEKAVLVGDRHHDLEGAEYIGIDAIGVTYGYGSREELLSCPHVYIADSPDEVYRFITKEE